MDFNFVPSEVCRMRDSNKVSLGKVIKETLLYFISHNETIVTKNVDIFYEFIIHFAGL